MPRPLIFAANWKMHIGPDEARAYARDFLAGFRPGSDRRYLFFPSTVSLEATSAAFTSQSGVEVGVQDVHWEPKGAFTGATSVALAARAGAGVALVGHSERRHVFGETEADTARKVRAVLDGGLQPLLCVGEKLEEREAGSTKAVVIRQLRTACADLSAPLLSKVIVAYEPVWAIGTGRNATPDDAATVHRAIRAELEARGHTAPRILYGGSVNAANVSALLSQRELDGVLVGGASLDPVRWRAIVGTAVS